MDGWVGNILRVNLSSEDYVVEDLDSEIAKKFIGGQGLASKILFAEVDPTVDSLSPENKLIFSTGPLTGTGAVCGARAWWVAKSPLTGTIGFTCTGGYFPAEIKFAGYDMIIFEGKADEPVYLWIEDDEVEIRSAIDLWSKDTSEVEDLIRSEIKDSWKARETRIACIGPAGENLVKLASIINDKHRAAGRGGLGAVMGSKNLKAVVVRGTGSISIAKPEEFRRAMTTGLEEIKASPFTSENWPKAGSGSCMEPYNEVGLIPYNNFQQLAKEGGVSNVTGEVIAEKYLIRNRGCFGCPMACGGPCDVKDPKYQGKGDRPEYETHALMTANLGVLNKPAFLLKTNFLCNGLGMDTISVSGTLATAMELYEKGFLPEEDAGCKLNFGNAEAVIELITKTAMREGFGDDLAEGGYRLAEKYGHPEVFIGVKKLEFPAYDVRSAHGMGVQTATSTRGACHCRGYTIAPEVLGLPEKVDPLTEKGKGALAKHMQDMTAGVIDASGICLFSILGQTPPTMVAQLEAATGVGYTLENVEKAGERIWNLQHIFNRRAGFTRKDDTIPRRFREEPAPGGPGKGTVVDIETMLNEYYKERGWDEEGNPKPAKLAELGLEEDLS